MDVARPYSAVSPTLEGDVLVVLARTHEPLTGREVAALVKRGSQKGTAAALARLVAHGIVRRTPAGRAHLHRLNREHLAAPAVEALTDLRSVLFARLRAHIAGWAVRPVHVSVFGSAARGDGSTGSDVDVLVVRPDALDTEDPDWVEQLGALADRLEAWTGNRPSVVDLGRGELATAEDLLADVERDGVDIAGVAARKLRAALPA